MPHGAGRVGDDRDRAQLARASAGSSPRGLARHQRERLRQQAVAGQDRHAFAEDHVAGRPSAAQRVVVHRGQVVVDQRVGVNELERAGGRQRQRAPLRRRLRRWPRDRFGGREREQRPQPLAAGEEAVAHGFADARRAGRRRTGR